MPHVAITMIPGRDEKTKRELAQKTQAFLQKELGIDPKFISVFSRRTGPSPWSSSQRTLCLTM